MDKLKTELSRLEQIFLEVKKNPEDFDDYPEFYNTPEFKKDFAILESIMCGEAVRSVFGQNEKAQDEVLEAFELIKSQAADFLNFSLRYH